MAVSNVLSIGNHALMANQVALQVTGNNINNVNTEGYSKQNVLFEAFSPYDSRVGQMGMGATVTEITRSFDRLLENTYLERYTQEQRYTTQSGILNSVQNIFNESNREGISSSMTEFFNKWQQVSLLPDDLPTKEALLTEAEALTGIIRDTQTTLEDYQEEINDYITNDVERVNEIIEAIAQLNTDITKSTYPGNTPNSLLDQRDTLVRELAQIVDVDVDDTSKDFTVRLANGLPLVQGASTYSLQLQSNEIEYQLEGYTGKVEVSGTDAFEYTLEFGNADQFRVSLDGGKTWLTNPDGSTQYFTAPPPGESVKVKDLEITFTEDDYITGDTITIVPKTGLYWVEPTRDPVNITPQIYGDGSDDESRLTGGSLTAYFNTRDHNIGKYMDKMDALASSLIWEVNAIHSQGASTFPQSAYYGSEEIENRTVPLGESGSGMAYFDRLQAGNMTVYLHDEATGEEFRAEAIDFDPTTPEIDNFDPAKHSLDDVVNAINGTFAGDISAQVVNGKLELTARDGLNLSFGQDSTGLLAGLGINTFFTGSDAGDIALNDDLRNNPALVNSGQRNEAGVLTAGDNSIALQIAKLATEAVQINTAWESTSQSLTAYYSGVVSLVGAETSNANFNMEYNAAMSSDLYNRILSNSGVSLDEEMTNLVKFQHSYTAAAKLITTADEMLQTVLGLKQ